MQKTGNKAVLYVLIFVAFALLMSATQLWAREKIILAVCTFADETDKKLGSKASDAVTDTFVKLKYFKVVERNRIDQVLSEVAHQQSGLVDDSTASEVGNQLGAKVVVVGSVTSAGYSTEKSSYKDDDGKEHVTLTAVGKVSLNVRMINIETSQIVFSKLIEGTSRSSYKPGSTKPDEGVLLNKALQNATRDIYRPIQKAFPLRGTVVKKEDKWVWIDFGSDWGIGWKRGLIFYRKGEPIRHPETGEIIGQDYEKIAGDSVSEVMENMCKAKLSKKEAARVKVGDIVEAKPQNFF